MSKITTPQGVELAYESMGPSEAPAIILIMGLGAQMHIWPNSLCRSLINAGFRVIRFDNRDAGQSTQFIKLGKPSLLKVWFNTRRKRPTTSLPYTLEDMADDVLGLMDALHIESAHVVGASMGGMIAQILAATHKRRVRSLTSIMSSATTPKLPVTKLQVLLLLARRPKSDSLEAHTEHLRQMNGIIGSPSYPMTEEELQQMAQMSWQRGQVGHGFKRQLAAITHAGDRRKILRKIKVRTLVIHGADDPLIPVTMGIETAANIKKAKLKIVFGMGHNFPEALMPKLSKMLIKHIKENDQRWLKKRKNRLLSLVSDALPLDEAR